MSEARPKPHRVRRWLGKLALLAASFLLCALVLEMVLRLAGYGHLAIYEADPKLYWQPKPNQHCYTKVGHQPVHINSLGTRGAEFQAKKPPDTLRILSLGDSRTFGWGLSDTETYSARLQKLLQDHLGNGQTVEVINAGVNAWSYSQMRVYFRDVAMKYSPDIVIVGEANLWTQFSEDNNPEFVRKFMRRVRLKNFLRRFATYHYIVEVQLKDYYERYRTKFIPVNPDQDQMFQAQQKDDPDAVFRKAITGICQLARTNGIRPVLLFLPTLSDLTSTNESRVLRVKQAVSESQGVPLLDLSEQLRDGGDALYLEADPVHLDAQGNEIIAQGLSKTITRMLSE